MPVGVRVRVGVLVRDGVRVAVGVRDGVRVTVGNEVTVGVLVSVGVDVIVGVAVGVGVRAGVKVLVGVFVGTGVNVPVGEGEGVSVCAGVSVRLGVGVMDGAGEAVALGDGVGADVASNRISAERSAAENTWSPFTSAAVQGQGGVSTRASLERKVHWLPSKTASTTDWRSAASSLPSQLASPGTKSALATATAAQQTMSAAATRCATIPVKPMRRAETIWNYVQVVCTPRPSFAIQLLGHLNALSRLLATRSA